jgi:aerobic-type carbon monoxide dehydrogenase small subunit (CoxS/CutS family)
MAEERTSDLDLHSVQLEVNGEAVQATLESRVSLADYLRHGLGLVGTHLGCEQGSCGACTVLVDGEAVRSCLLLAVQLDGAKVETVESLAVGGVLSPLQQAFHDHHALQCGFCTSGFLMSLTARLRERPVTDEHDAREALSGNICRCTGYAGMVAALLSLSGAGAGEEHQ